MNLGLRGKVANSLILA